MTNIPATAMASTGINYIIKFSTSLLFAVLMVFTCTAQETESSFKDFSFQDADLIFVVPKTPNAITQVTQGSDNLAADHVAIMHLIGGTNGLPYAIEAIGRGVCLTPVDSFMAQNENCELLVARLQQIDASASVHNALRFVGRPYDYFFELGDSALYCSELVQLAFVQPDGKAVFTTIPMSFHDSTGAITPYWTEFYSRHKRQVPEGAPGTNPTQLLNAARALKSIIYSIRP
jgi:hypothetical protein